MSMNMMREGSAADRISGLPYSILEQILGYLPLRDAIRTSILSREWRYKWVVRSELAFDFIAGKEVFLNIFIYKVLQIQQGPLRKFSLAVCKYEIKPDIDQWIQYLSKKNVLGFSLKGYSPPAHLFNFFQDLRHLELAGCNFHPPPNFNFSRLTTLNFSFVTFEPTSFQALLSSSSFLERVTLICCTSFDSFIVDASSLKFFEFSGVAKSICLKNTPLLEEATLGQYYDYGSFIVGVPEPPVILRNIKLLNFSSSAFSRVEWVAHVLQLINSSPNLKRLQIVFYSYNKEADPVEPAVKHLLQSKGMPDSALKHLKSVDVTFKGFTEAQMEFLKYVLSSATKLEKFCVWTRDRYNHLGMKKMEEMKQFPRTSPNVEFIYRVIYTK